MSLEDNIQKFVENRRESINEQRSLIGQFVIEFERVSQLIRFCILHTCYPKPERADQVKIGILTEGLTVFPLEKAFKAFIAEFHPEIKNEYSKARKLFENLIAIRNKLLHGNYSLGIKLDDRGSIVDNDSFILKKPSSQSNGFDDQPYNLTTEYLETIVQRARTIVHSYGLIDCYIREKSKTHSSEEALSEFKSGIVTHISDLKPLDLSKPQ